MTEDNAKRLAFGVAHWLEYQILCGRKALLSESYLSHSVGEFLGYVHKGGIETEWVHSTFRKAQRGRPRQIDFVTKAPYKNGRIIDAVEAKWVKPNMSPQSIIDDLLRLECIRTPGSSVYRIFLLAGQKSKINQALIKAINYNGTRYPFLKSILDMKLDEEGRIIDVRDDVPHLNKILKSFSSGYGVKLPRKFSTKLIADINDKHSAVRVMLWNIRSVPNRRVFNPDVPWKSIEVPSVEDEAEEITIEEELE